MLLEHALMLHNENIVAIKGVWVDPNKVTHEGRVLNIDCVETGIYSIVVDGMWGNSPVTVSQEAPTQVTTNADDEAAMSVQFGGLLLKVDHYRNNPMEWLAEHGMPLSSPQQESAQPAGGVTL